MIDVPFDPVVVLFLATVAASVIIAIKVKFVRRHFIPLVFIALLALVAVDNFFGSTVRVVSKEENVAAKEVTYRDTHTLFGLRFVSDERTRVEPR
jgi:hypothetical protein